MKKQYLLDTNICIHLLHDKFSVKERILEAGIENCHISDITLAELYYGAYNSDNVSNSLEGVNLLASMFDVVYMDHAVVKRFGQEKATLRLKGQMIDDFDILIGTSALVNNMTLVSENVKHLQRLPISLENWVSR